MDDRTWSLLLNTLLMCSATCAISLPAGTLLAWILSRTDMPGRRAVTAVLALMLFVPLYLQAAAWQAGFGLQGWYTLAYAADGWLQGWRGAVWVHGLAAVPWVALIVGLGLRWIAPEAEEQALLDGSPRQVVLRVTLPNTWPAVAVAGLWVAVTTAGEMTVTDLFGVRTYAEELYTRTAIGPQPGDAPLGLMSGTVLTIVLVIAALAMCAKLAPLDRRVGLGRRWIFCLGPWRIAMVVLVVMAMLLLAGVPLASLCYKAGVMVTQVEDGRVRHWSAAKCLRIVGLAPWAYRWQFGWSLLLGTLSASSALIVAIVLAWIARRGGRRALPALLVIALGLAVPGPVLGLGIISLLNRPGCPTAVWLYDRSILAPCLALTIRALPPATLLVWHALRTVPQEMLDAAAVDGAGPVMRLVAIALPNRLAALALAWVVGLAVSIADLGAVVLVVPPGVVPLSIEIFQLLHAGVEDHVAGICLAMMALLALLALAVAWLARRASRGA